MIKISNKKTDQSGYDEEYKDNASNLSNITSISKYIDAYQSSNIGSYHKSRNTKGYVRGEVIKRLIANANKRNIPFKDMIVLDAGSG